MTETYNRELVWNVTVLGEDKPRFSHKTRSLSATKMIQLRAKGLPAFLEVVRQ